MGKFVNNVKEFFAYCEDNDVQFVDFRFTDIKGAWHHISYRMSAVTEDQLAQEFASSQHGYLLQSQLVQLGSTHP